MGTQLWINTAYGVDWWARLVGQSPNESQGFERNGSVLGIERWGRSPPG